jgi:hypothetical protein
MSPDQLRDAMSRSAAASAAELASGTTWKKKSTQGSPPV